MSDGPTPPQPGRRWRLPTWLRYGLIALAVIVTGLFLARRQIGTLLARELDQRLSAAGIFVSWQSADWVPGPGIRLHGLALYRDAAKRDRLAHLGNVTALKGDPEWSRWDTVNLKVADARLTLSAGDGETKLEHLEMRLTIQPGKADLQECRASLQGLRIEAKGAYARTAPAVPSDGHAATKATGPDKGLFSDVTLDWLKPLKEWLKFQSEKDEPVLRLEFHPIPDGSGLDFAAALDGSRFQWRGQKWDLVQAAVKTSFGDKAAPVEIDHVRLGHAGQRCEFAGSFDPGSGVLRIRKFESGIDLLALSRALFPEAGGLAAIGTTGAWRLSGEGEIPVDHPERTVWNGHAALDGELVYAAGDTPLKLQKPAFALRMEDQVLSLSGLKAGLWDGSLDAPLTRIQLATEKTNARFETQLTLSHARLQSVRNSFGAAQRQPGIVEFNWKGGGAFELVSITGSGAVTIHEAEFYRVPLLGPLHLVFDQLTPGFGRDVASTMTSNYRMGGGTLQIENMRLESKLTRIEANGSIDLSRQYARLTAKAKLQGIVGLATSVLSALLEVEGEGPVSEVRWKLKNVPGAGLVGGAADVVGKTGGMVIEGAGGAVKETGKAAKGLLKLPGKLFQGK